MVNVMRKCITCFALMALVLTALTHAQDRRQLIYIAHSYNPESFSWTAEEYDGILKGFELRGLMPGTDYEIVSETMDVLVKSSKEQMKSEAARILKDIAAKKPDLIMTTDDDAFKFVGLEITDIPIVFCGVNGIPNAYLVSPLLDSIEKPGHNVTGVYQTTYFVQSLEFVQQLSPDAKSFAVLTDETTTSYALMKDLQTQKASLPLEMKDILVSKEFSDWQTNVREWQNSVDAIFVLSANSVHDGAGNVMAQDDVVKWIAENSSLPDTAPWALQVAAGILVSASDSGELQGVHSAFLATEILNGADPGNLPIVTPPNGVPVLNGTRAEKLPIELSADLLTIFIDVGEIFE